MKLVKGDLIKLALAGEFELIAHGCNCFCAMGKGIALGIKTQFPNAYESDLQTAKGDRAKLGTCSFAVHDSLIIVNCYTQYDWRGSGLIVDYDAIRSCMRWINENYSDRRIGLPFIGAGLAGGDWAIIKPIIAEELIDTDLTIVEYQP